VNGIKEEPMSDHPFQSTYRHQACPRPRSIVRTALVWGAIAIVAMMVFGTGIWAIGLIFHLIGLLFQIALITAVAAFVWRWVTRRNHRSYNP
jgi:hypothetical protein